MTTQTVEELLAERARIEPGLSRGFFVSAALHVVVTAAVLLAPILFPKEAPFIPIKGTFVPLPPGGRGVSDPAPPSGPAGPANAPPVTAPPVTTAAAPPVTAAPAPKVIKPPVDKPKGLPALNDKTRKPPKATPPPARTAGSSRTTSPAGGRPGAAGGVTPGATGTKPQTPGLELAPPGEGVPGGTDPFGDWYLASVQRKIWMLWLQQSKPAGHPPVHVMFTILADGSVTDIQVVQGSGNRSLDFSAQRAVSTAAPFSPLPRHYGTNRKTIQAIFRPT